MNEKETIRVVPMPEASLKEFPASEQARQRRMMAAFAEIDPCPACGAVLPENRENCVHDFCPL